MRSTKNTLMLATMIAMITLFSCDDSNGPNKKQVFLRKLGQTWKLTTGYVKVDGVDVTEAFTGMEITFYTDKTYTVTNAEVAPIWPASGHFTIQPGDDILYNILRDDGILVTVAALTDTTIKLQLDYTASGSRVKSVSGAYEFLLNK